MTDSIPVPLSASKLKTWEECAERFRLRYVARKQVPEIENHWIRRGNAVHEAIETVLAEGSPRWDESYVRHRFTEAYRDNGGADGYALTDENHEFVVDCLAVAARMLAKYEPEIREVEAEVNFAADSVDHPEGFIGYIDLATEDEVWDWKTGKSDGKDLDETLQGAVYMAGFAHRYGRPPETVRFAYLKEEKQVTFEPSDEAWETVVAKADALLTGMEFEEYPTDPEEAPCYYCDYEAFCPASPVGAGNIDWETYP